MKLKNKIVIKGNLKVETGLHIGGTKETFQIGGLDNPVIKIKKMKKKEEPYIPGSSLKGKIRSLLEREKGEIEVKITYFSKQNNKIVGETKKKYKEITEKDLKEIPEEYKSKGANDLEIKANPCNCGICKICTLFGSSSAKTTKRPSILIFRDAYSAKPLNEEELKEITEIKTENVIDRIKGTAENPRQIERVVPGTEFEVEVILNVYEGDDDVKKHLESLKEGFELLQNDYLGGSGTRGYGKVDVSDIIKAIDEEIGKINKN